MGQDYHTVDKVAEYGHKLTVVAGLEISPGEVIVLGLRSICREHIAQHILLAGKIAEIFVEPHGPVARGRDLITLEVEKLVGRHIVGQLIVVAVGHKHGRKDDAVEHDIVLAYEIDYAGIGVFPPFLPAVGINLLGVGYIAYRGVEPHIKHLTFGFFQRHGHTPVEIAGHSARLPEIEPRFALAVDIGFPLLVTFEDPLTEL